MRVPAGWNPTRRLLTIDEAAQSACRPASTIRRWIHEGRLHPYATMGRRALLLESEVLALEADIRRRQPCG